MAADAIALVPLQAEIIEALLDGGASVGAADRHGRTVMHHLAACPHPSALRALQSILSRWRDRNAPAGETRPTKRIEGALDVNRRDSEGRTPLHVACSSWLNALHLSWQGVARNGGPAGAGERSGRRPDWGAGKGAGLGYAQERMRPASGSRPGTADGRGATGDMWLRKRGMKLRASRVDRSWEKREDGSAGEGREGSREGVGGRSEAEKGDPKAHAPLVVWVIQELIEAGANVSAVVGAGLQSPERSRLGESTEGEMRNGGGQNCVHLAMQCLVQAANEVLLAQRREREVLDSRCVVRRVGHKALTRPPRARQSTASSAWLGSLPRAR